VVYVAEVVHFMVARKHRDEKRQGTKCIIQGMPPVTYIL
jgi:hypothetical protein